MSLIIDFHIPEKERAKTPKLLEPHFKKKHLEKIEEGIYDYTKQYCLNNSSDKLLAPSIYKDTRKNLIFNFESSNQTIGKIKKEMDQNKFNPYNLAFLRPEELNEDNWIRIMMRMSTTEERLNNLPTVKWKPCFRCQCTQYSFYQLQTRSIDEPVTSFYICKECGKNYSINV
jgi:DNA-directed RNA polymerase subunit M/transcription elongation factor TFIIS